jgi:hypothetical protein
MSIRVRSGFGYRWIYVTPSAMPGNTGGYRRKRGHPALWKRWRMFRRVALGRADSVLVVLLLSPVVTSVAWRNNCGCLDDLFYLCTGVADALGNSG